MKARQQRMLAVGLAVLGLAIAAALTLRAFRDNMMFFVSVSEVVAGDYPHERKFRVGGLVVDGSVQRADGSLDVHFLVTDMRCEIPVTYTGVLPDLFREGQGVVAHGIMQQDVFVADEVLAKHDENYMAPEVAESMAQHVEENTAALRENGAECTS
ncbi:MAG TPA: cytochrome c maturation protein CcmE [Woeseiaceae bacterium]|nr:cytochrome c maturation protein CcmE [Woeseiaceae bacterium]